MSEGLRVRIVMGGRERIVTVPLERQTGGEVLLKGADLLEQLNRFLFDIRHIISHEASVWVESGQWKKSLWELVGKEEALQVFAGEGGEFEVKVRVQDREQKHNLLRHFHNNHDHFTKLNSNINKIIHDSEEAQRKRGAFHVRPIDIAYFFADPLVKFQGKEMRQTTPEVSYQVEYDRFIELVKKEEFGNNFRIEMMVATKSNIRTTITEGASILHFACHGERNTLHIESERSIGELLILNEAEFTPFLNPRTPLPKLIIFNACHSKHIAQKIGNRFNELGIVTIGYEGSANDRYCEMFTRQFYIGVFKDKMPVRQLFSKIKGRILAQNEKEGSKLWMFPIEEGEGEQKLIHFESEETKFNYVKRWTFLESLREGELIGVRTEMFNFMKKFLLHNERMSYLLLLGRGECGKTSFMKKVKIYTMNRNCFTEDMWQDLRVGQNGVIRSVLQLRLQKQEGIKRRVKEIKQHLSDGRSVPLFVFDHCDDLMRFQYRKLIQLIEKLITKELKVGKVVIISNRIQPLLQPDAFLYNRALAFEKQLDHKVDNDELKNYINRYVVEEELKSAAFTIYKQQRDSSYEQKWKVDLVKAIKRSKSADLFKEEWQRVNSQQSELSERRPSYQQMEYKQAKAELAFLQTVLAYWRSRLSIRVGQNHAIFLSTIFDNQYIQMPSACSAVKDPPPLTKVTADFELLYKSIFRNLLGSEVASLLKPLINFSMGLACVLYFSIEHGLFEWHLLGCQRMQVMAKLACESNQKDLQFVPEVLAVYNLQLLLTLYGYYSQRCTQKECLVGEGQEWRAKMTIIKDEIELECSQPRRDQEWGLVQQLLSLNKLSQEVCFNPAFHFSNHHMPQRKLSGEQSDGLNETPEQLLKKVKTKLRTIREQHANNAPYWKNYLKLVSSPNRSLILKKTTQLFLLNGIKLVHFSLSELQLVVSRGERFLNEQTIDMLDLYTEIMQTVDEERVFPTVYSQSENGLFCSVQSHPYRYLYQLYFKNYIVVYFRLQKLRQTIDKQYNLRVFKRLLDICSTSRYVSGIRGLKKLIELHINEQFFNIWTCTTLVALPLKDQTLCNIKRYQAHIHRFHEELFQCELDKELKYQILRLDEDILRSLRKEQRSIIQLVICDVKPDGQVVFFENTKGELSPYNISEITLPTAPVVILVGHNTDEMQRVYHAQNNKSLLIWITFPVQRYTSRELDSLAKNKKYKVLTQYSVDMDIEYSVLQFFYCSFARHFFNTQHELFTQQVKNSFDLAVAEAMIKTKLRLGFKDEKTIKAMCDSIDNNLSFLVGTRYGKELAMRPAYSFLCKQKNEEGASQEKKEGIWRIGRAECELGCNKEVVQILSYLFENKEANHLSVQIMYNSDLALKYCIASLKAKLMKMGQYHINDTVLGSNYAEEEEDDRLNESALNASQFEEPHSKKQVTVFVNLSQQQVLFELAKQDETIKTVKIYVSNQTYSLTKMPIFCLSMNSSNSRALFLMALGQGLRRKGGAKESKVARVVNQVCEGKILSLQRLREEMDKI